MLHIQPGTARETVLADLDEMRRFIAGTEWPLYSPEQIPPDIIAASDSLELLMDAAEAVSCQPPPPLPDDAELPF